VPPEESLSFQVGFFVSVAKEATIRILLLGAKSRYGYERSNIAFDSFYKYEI